MATRGTPIPIAVRQQIRERTAEVSRRQAAAELGIHRNTVNKYATKFVPKN